MIRLLSLSPYTGDTVSPSPNHDAREAPAIEGIVLHATADQGEEALALSWLRSPKSRVSCHLFVSRSGRVARLVGDRQRAWHAGISWWRGTDDVNSITLGIEIANRNDGEPYTEAQYQRVAEIVAHYCCQGLSLQDVVSHAEITEGRKTDPLQWDWRRFREMVQQQMLVANPPPIPPVRTPEPSLPVPPVVVSPVAPPRQPAIAIATPKSVLQSRTLWLNALTLLAAAPLLMDDTLDLAHRTGIHLPEGLTKWALFLLGLLNMILRLRTSQPLACGKNVPCPRPEVPMSRPAQPQMLVKERRQRPRGEATVH